MAQAQPSFLTGFIKHYREKKLLRWLAFTYPKTTASIIMTATGLFIYQVNEESKYIQKKDFAFQEAIHANDNITRRNKDMVIYGGGTKN